MNQLFSDDISNAIQALETYIIFEEEQLVRNNAGDTEWSKLDPFKKTLSNFLYLERIYG